MFDIRAAEIAKILDGVLVGNPDILISNINNLEYAKKGDLTFFSDFKYADFFEKSTASCIITNKNISKKPLSEQTFILVDNPHLSFTKFLEYINSLPKHIQGFIHPSAIIEENVIIADTAYIGGNVYIGKCSIIGEKTIIKPNVSIYENVKVGENTLIHSNVTIYQDVRIGNNCIIHASAVIGSDGFGYNENHTSGVFSKIPQLGAVYIEDDVEIGACSTIDRAMLGNTIIRKGAKIDNLVHIGHNSEIGENTAFAAQTGISGTVKVGKRNRFGGQVGVAGHLETADDVILMAKSGINKSIDKSGVYFGAPARDKIKAFRIEAAIKRLPEIVEFIDKMKKKDS